MLVTVKEWLKSVLNYCSYSKNKTGYPFFGPPCTLPLLYAVDVSCKYWLDIGSGSAYRHQSIRNLSIIITSRPIIRC